MDKIMIKGLKIFAHHGVLSFEKEKGQTFIIDAVMELDFDMACRTDLLEHTVNYSSVIKTITETFTAKSYDLLETAADKVTDAVFIRYPSIHKITVTVKKPEAPIKADFDYVGVEITREVGKYL